MDIKPNPFSLYDFLGYFTPGAILIYGVLLVIGHASALGNPAVTVFAPLNFESPELYVPFILASYTLGHLLSFVSSVTIERYSIWAVGYPSKYLIGLAHDGYFHAKEHVWLRRVIRALVALILLPVSLLDLVFGHWLKMRDLYAKSLDSLLIALLRDKVLELLKKKAELAEPTDHGRAASHDYFRYVYHYAVEHAPNHVPKMQNYVALYGFLRTATLLAVILFWVVVWHVLCHPLPFATGGFLLGVSAIVAFLFYMSFVKFYRRFSLEALMAVSVCFRSKA